MSFIFIGLDGWRLNPRLLLNIKTSFQREENIILEHVSLSVEIGKTGQTQSGM